MLKDKLLRWDDGTWKRIEMAFDVTEYREKQDALNERLETEKQLLLCVQDLSSSTLFLEAVERSMNRLGNFLECDRVYLFEFDGDRMSNTHEWCAAGIKAEKDELQNMPRTLITRWEKLFDKGENVVICNLENICESDPGEYDVLHRQGIHSLVAAPLFAENELIGYMGVDNPPPVLIAKVPFLFGTLSYLYANTIMRHRTYEKMKHMSYYDSLTELHNRNSYMGDLKNLQTERPRELGVVFMDVNGLKSINDTYGHEAGDACLKFVSRKLAAYFGEYRLYRLGGDEFLALCAGISRTEFDKRLQSLTESVCENGRLAASIGSEWSADVSNVNELIGRADKKMYEVKRRYYCDYIAPEADNK